MKISDRILTSCLALIAVAFTFLVAAGIVRAEPTAYITLGEADGVAVMDTANNSVAPAAVAVGTDPQYMAFSPDGLKIYVTNNGSDNISVIDARTNLVTSTIAGVPDPVGLDIDPDGTKLYVVNSALDGKVSIIDLTTETVTDTIPVGSMPVDIAYVSSFAGKFLYVTNNFDNSISVISLSSKTVTKTLSIATTTAEAAPNGIVANNNNNRAYVACGGQAAVYVINTGNHTILAGKLDVGDQPDQLAVSSDGNELYVTNNNADSVSIYNLITNASIGTVPVEDFPKGIVLNSDDTKIYVANKRSNSISIVDVTVSPTFPTETISLGSGTGPVGVGISSYIPILTNSEFVAQLYLDFLGRSGTATEIQNWVTQLDSGTLSWAELVDTFLWDTNLGGKMAPIARLYFATFLRKPDYSGLTYWTNRYVTGTSSLNAIALFFANSPEFQIRYGSLTNEGFVTLLYQNVLGRLPDVGGLAYWVGLLDSGSRTRGQILLGFSESTEYQYKSHNKVHISMTYARLLLSSPDQNQFDNWVEFLTSGNSTVNFIDDILNSDGYVTRFL